MNNEFIIQLMKDIMKILLLMKMILEKLLNKFIMNIDIVPVELLGH